MRLEIVILAAGQGTRMNSLLPKVLHPIAAKPMLRHVYDTALLLKPHKIHVVVGHGADQVKRVMDGLDINWVMQDCQLGTGHAVAQALPYLDEGSIVLVLYGDVPLVSQDSLSGLLTKVSTSRSMAILTVQMDDPGGYGRIIRNELGDVSHIVEQKDASEEQLSIKEVNTGILAVSADDLCRWLPLLDCQNAQNEYYLTDIVSMAKKEGLRVDSACARDVFEVMGVNNRSQQAQLERIYQRQLAASLMAAGVRLIDPERFDCRGNLRTGRDVAIDINVIVEGDVQLGDNVVIESNCVLKNVVIGSNSHIKANSILEGARIGEGVDVGPFARIRPGTVLENFSRIGNFVETKNITLGESSKANHLAYLGDASIGSECNIGAGTITCNYDGVNKHHTKLGSHVFVGSNSTLVAPLTIGNDGFVGAGSTITKNVPEGSLAVGRGQQRNIDGWKRPGKK